MFRKMGKVVSLPGALAMARLMGGIPLQVDFWQPRKEDCRGAFNPVRSVLLVVAMVVGYGSVLYWSHLEFGAPFELEAFHRALRLPREDTVMSVIVFVLGLGSTLAYFALFIAKRRDIGQFYYDSFRLKSDAAHVPHEERRMGGRVFWWCLVRIALGVGAGVMYGLALYDAAVASRAAKTYDFLLAVGSGSCIALGSLGNMLIGSGIMMSLDVVLILYDLLEGWRLAMAAAGEKGVGAVRENVRFGRAFCELTSRAIKLAAPFILVTYTYFLIGGVLFTYGAISVFYDDLESKVIELISLANFVIAVAFYFSILNLSMTGNLLTAKASEVRSALREVELASADAIGRRERLQLEHLDRALGDDVRVRPYDFFEMSNANFLSVIATHATYIIVALQFKAS